MKSSKEYLTTLFTIYICMILGQVILLILSISVMSPVRNKTNEYLFLGINMFILIGGIYLAYNLSLSEIQKAKTKSGIREKLHLYQKALLIRWGILEVLTIISIIFYLLTKQDFFVFISILLIAISLVNKPSIQTIIDNLNLDEYESRILKTPDAVI